MELENWKQILLILLGVVVLWSLVGLAFRLARRVISCGCGLIVVLTLVYLYLRWTGTL